MTFNYTLNVLSVQPGIGYADYRFYNYYFNKVKLSKKELLKWITHRNEFEHYSKKNMKLAIRNNHYKWSTINIEENINYLFD